MAKLDELASERPHASRSGWHRSGGWLLKRCDLLMLLFFLFSSTDPVWFSARVPAVAHDASLTDDSWHLDEVYKLSRGLCLGRDVAFTHGPIFQWLSSVPTRFLGVSMGAIFATWNAVLLWCTFVFVYLTLRMLLAEQPAWKRALLLFLIVVFWLVFWEYALQIAFPVLLFAIFLRGWYAVTERRVTSYVLGTAAALLCIIAFLIATDAGVYSAAAWVIATAAVFLEERRNQSMVGWCLAALLAYTVSGFVFALIVNAAMGRVFDFRFWKDSAQIVNVYRWATPAAITNAGTARLLATVIASAAIFLVRAFTRSKQNPAITERAGFLLGGFTFGLLMMQTALVMSHLGHVQSGTFAMVLLAGIVLFSFPSGRTSCVAVVLAIVCSALFSGPAFGPGTVIRLVRKVWQPATQCPVGLREFDRGCFTPEFASMLQSTTSYLGQHSGPLEHIVVFPYQTMFGIASRRSVAGGLMQAFTASGPYLTHLEIAGLEAGPAPAGLYATDVDWGFPGGHPGVSESDEFRCRNLAMSRPILGVYNFTRTPEVWFWMLQHYRTEGAAPAPGIVGLLRDDSRAARISLQSQTLGLAARTFPIRERSSVEDLGVPAWPADADFLRLRLTVRYSFWWKLRKPDNLQVEITRTDGSRDLRWVIAQPNVSSEIWLYPWSQSDLSNYLESDEHHWRTTPHPAITHLRIIATPLDWVSVTPNALILESADSVRIDMRP